MQILLMLRKLPICPFEATILFADISGYTAWSSMKASSGVNALDTIFRAFDQIARQWNVFQVETVVDCYVAVVGVPEPLHISKYALLFQSFGQPQTIAAS